MGSALLHLVCRWDATFCSNKQKKQLSPFWSKISETIGGTIWSTSSIRYWAVWIAEFYKMLNANIDWISGVWGFLSFPLFLELSGYEQRYDQEEGWQQERKMSWSPQFVIQFPALLWNTKDMTAGFAFLPGSAVLCRTPWPHRLSLLQNNRRWFPLPVKNQLTHKDFFSDFCFLIASTPSTQPQRRMFASLSVITLLFTLVISFKAKTVLYLFFLCYFLFDCCWLVLAVWYFFFVPVEETAYAQEYVYSTEIYTKYS